MDWQELRPSLAEDAKLIAFAVAVTALFMNAGPDGQPWSPAGDERAHATGLGARPGAHSRLPCGPSGRAADSASDNWAALAAGR